MSGLTKYCGKQHGVQGGGEGDSKITLGSLKIFLSLGR